VTKSNPESSVDESYKLDLDRISEESAKTLLHGLEVEEPSDELISVIQQDAAVIARTFSMDARATKTSERAAALRKLGAVLSRLKLEERLGPVQRERITQRLRRYEAPSGENHPVEYVHRFQQLLARWVHAADRGTVPLPRGLSASVRKTAKLFSSLDDFTVEALVDGLLETPHHEPAAPAPSSADPIQALISARDRLLKAIDQALRTVPKSGPVGRPALHVAVSYLAPRYQQLTGKWPPSNANEATAERDPFFRFVYSMLEAAGYPQSFAGLHRAIRLYCRGRARRLRKRAERPRQG
jgi:hypothetical protein